MLKFSRKHLECLVCGAQWLGFDSLFALFDNSFIYSLWICEGKWSIKRPSCQIVFWPQPPLTINQLTMPFTTSFNLRTFQASSNHNFTLQQSDVFLGHLDEACRMRSEVSYWFAGGGLYGSCVLLLAILSVIDKTSILRSSSCRVGREIQ